MIRGYMMLRKSAASDNGYIYQCPMHELAMYSTKEIALAGLYPTILEAHKSELRRLRLLAYVEFDETNTPYCHNPITNRHVPHRFKVIVMTPLDENDLDRLLLAELHDTPNAQVHKEVFGSDPPNG